MKVWDRRWTGPLWISVTLTLLGFFGSAIEGNQLNHLGAEYDNIARAIYAGRGFADPFGIETGPTAWMPPMLSVLLAAAYWSFGGQREGVITLYVLFQAVVVAWTFFLILSQANRMGRPGWGVVITLIAWLVNLPLLFYQTHDHAFLLAVVNGLYLLLSHRPRETTDRGAAMQGVVGGLIALCSPVIATAWALWVAVQWHSVRRISIAALVSIVVIAPWIVRNAVVFGRFIPIKSASSFELWQSTCLDDDGVIDMRVFMTHPYDKDVPSRRHYAAIGETAFIQEHRARCIDRLIEAPLDALTRCVNRMMAATVFYSPIYVLPSLPGVQNLREILYMVPFFAAIFWVSFGRTHRSPRTDAALWIYVAVLTPYILISYYERYATPLIGMKALIVLFALDLMLTPSRPGVAAPPPGGIMPDPS